VLRIKTKDYKFESQLVVIFSFVPTHIFYNTFFVKNNILYYYFLVLQQIIFSWVTKVWWNCYSKKNCYL